MTEVQIVPKGKVHPNTWNPNIVPDAIQSALGKNIKRAGMNQPILVRPHPDIEGEYEIVDGEHRWLEADETVPIIVRDFTKAEAMAQTLAMNKLRGEMEPADVARLLREIEEDGLSKDELATFTGYTTDELESLDGLLDFNWDDFGQTAPPDDDGSTSDGWVTLSYRVPEDVADLFTAEVDRLKHIRETEHDHLALEVMVQNSAQTTPAAMTGE